MKFDLKNWKDPRFKAVAIGCALAVLAVGSFVVGSNQTGPRLQQTFHVVASGGADTASCSSSQPCTLTDALDRVSNSAVTTIDVAGGTYPGTLVIKASVNLVGQGTSGNPTSFVGRPTGSPVVVVDTGTVSLSNVSISGGSGTNETYGAGGIDNNGTLTLTDVSVHDNSVTHSLEGAGGIVNIGTMSIVDSSVTNNTASGSQACAGGIANDGTLNISNSTITNNTCSGTFEYGAGGITNGGYQIAESKATSSSSLTINSGSSISSNSTGACGSCFAGSGALFNNGLATLTDVSIDSNVASQDGGGVYNTNSFALSDTTISRNTAGNNGGGIDSGDNRGSGTFSVLNSTLSGNTAAQFGGAIAIGNGSGTISSSTIVNNAAPQADGGGVFNEGTLSLAADILAINTTNQSSDCQNYGTITDVGYNVSDDSSCNLSVSNHSSSGAAVLANYLGVLANNGDLTQTVALLTTPSPVTQTADPAAGIIPSSFVLPSPSSVAACSIHDQAGQMRSAPCDAGSFELSQTVGFNADGGTAVPAITSPNGTTVTLPTGTFAGNSFNGWFTAASGGSLEQSPFSIPVGGVTLYAQWTAVATGSGGGGSTASSTTSTTLTPTTSPPNAPPPTATIPASSFGTPQSSTVAVNVPTTITNSSGGTSSVVTVPAGALPTGTTVSTYPVTSTAALSASVPSGQSYVVSFAVSWQAPDGTTPTASTPITMTITDPSIVAGDLIYEVTSTGLKQVGIATANGTAIITFSDDPIFVVSAAVSATTTTTRPIVAPTPVKTSTAKKAKVTITSTAASVSKTAASIKVSLRCTTATCSGTIKVTESIFVNVKVKNKTSLKKTQVAVSSKAYKLSKNQTGKYTLALTAKNKSIIANASQTPLQESIAVTAKNGVGASTGLSIS